MNYDNKPNIIIKLIWILYFPMITINFIVFTRQFEIYNSILSIFINVIFAYCSTLIIIIVPSQLLFQSKSVIIRIKMKYLLFYMLFPTIIFGYSSIIAKNDGNYGLWISIILFVILIYSIRILYNKDNILFNINKNWLLIVVLNIVGIIFSFIIFVSYIFMQF